MTNQDRARAAVEAILARPFPPDDREVWQATAAEMAAIILSYFPEQQANREIAGLLEAIDGCIGNLSSRSEISTAAGLQIAANYGLGYTARLRYLLLGPYQERQAQVFNEALDALNQAEGFLSHSENQRQIVSGQWKTDSNRYTQLVALRTLLRPYRKHRPSKEPK